MTLHCCVRAREQTVVVGVVVCVVVAVVVIATLRSTRTASGAPTWGQSPCTEPARPRSVVIVFDETTRIAKTDRQPNKDSASVRVSAALATVSAPPAPPEPTAAPAPATTTTAATATTTTTSTRTLSCRPRGRHESQGVQEMAGPECAFVRLTMASSGRSALLLHSGVRSAVVCVCVCARARVRVWVYLCVPHLDGRRQAVNHAAVLPGRHVHQPGLGLCGNGVCVYVCVCARARARGWCNPRTTSASRMC
jgi:hypothetical protein